jgi:flagellar basal-body rod protein FlgB
MAEPYPDEMAHTHPEHFKGDNMFDISMAGETRDDANIYHLDSVDIDREMTTLIENNIQYRASTEMLLRKMGMLRHAISGGQ